MTRACLAPVLLWALVYATAAAHAQPSPRSRQPAAAPLAAPCDLAHAPQGCAACPDLAAAVQRTSDPAALGRGPTEAGVLWTPLYVAFRLDCPAVGRALVERGADPHLGGRDGVLLVEVALMRFARPSPRPPERRSRAMQWVDLLARPGPFDLDRARDGGASARTVWQRVQAEPPAGDPAPAGAAAVWSRVLASSAAYPVLMDGAERVSPDHPAPDAGATRPSETAMAHGAEQMFAAYERGGMAEVAARVQSCYVEPHLLEVPRARWHQALDVCAALDAAAVAFDKVASRNVGRPRSPTLTDEAFERRTAALERFAQDGPALASYRRAVRRGAAVWLGINAALRTK